MNRGFDGRFIGNSLVGAVIVLVGILIRIEADRRDTERINSDELATALVQRGSGPAIRATPAPVRDRDAPRCI